MRGWVYIITNKAMPGLVKVGYTLKDPDLRARELGHTGTPLPYVVEYEVLVNKPRVVEQMVHSGLGGHRVGKEWFRCSLDEAINCIRRTIGEDALLETIRNMDNLRTPIGRRKAECASQPSSKAGSKGTFTSTGTFAANCLNCGTYFEVTVTRHDYGARCPKCSAIHDVSKFQRRFLNC